LRCQRVYPQVALTLIRQYGTEELARLYDQVILKLNNSFVL